MKKRIAHITFDMQMGGAEQVIYNLIENSDHSKYEISIICLDQPVGTYGRQLKKQGYELISFDRKPGFDFQIIRKIRQYIKNEDIRVLHCHQYTPFIYGTLASLFTKTKIIFTEHGRFYPDKRRLKRVLINPVLNLVTDYVTAISAATRIALIDNENFPREKIKLVYNGINASSFRRSPYSKLKKDLRIAEDAFLLGTVARLDPIKNQKIMIKALKNIHKTYPDTYLIILGDGPERENLQALTEELGLISRVIFTGFKTDTARYYSIMDIFLLTSFSEGTAMTLLEAMASELPCVVTNVGGNPEIIINSENGFVIPSNDEQALAKSIITLLGNSELRKKMGRAGRAIFEKKFTVDRMVSAYESMYDGNA